MSIISIVRETTRQAKNTTKMKWSEKDLIASLLTAFAECISEAETEEELSEFSETFSQFFAMRPKSDLSVEARFVLRSIEGGVL